MIADLFSWLLVAPIVGPLAARLVWELLDEARHAWWMSRHDVALCELLPRTHPERALPRGMVVDGELG